VPAESGTLTTDHRADSWRVDRTENQSIMVTVARMAGDLPLIVTLYDAAGQIIPLNSVAAVDQSNAIVYSAMAGAAGRYTIVIAAPAGSRTSTDTVYNISLAAP